jgi:hypothetical protein
VDAELLADRLPWYVTRFVGRERDRRARGHVEPAYWSTSGGGGLGKTRW